MRLRGAPVSRRRPLLRFYISTRVPSDGSVVFLKYKKTRAQPDKHNAQLYITCTTINTTRQRKHATPYGLTQLESASAGAASPPSTLHRATGERSLVHPSLLSLELLQLEVLHLGREGNRSRSRSRKKHRPSKYIFLACHRTRSRRHGRSCSRGPIQTTPLFRTVINSFVAAGKKAARQRYARERRGHTPGRGEQTSVVARRDQSRRRTRSAAADVCRLEQRERVV